jgi:hypothetical protein
MRAVRCLFWSPILLLLGCYTYSPAPLDTIPAGTRVRTRLTPVEMARIREILNREAGSVEGEWLGEEAGDLVLRVPVTVASYGGAGGAGGPGGAIHQPIRIPRGEVVEVEVRRLDRVRTAALVAAGAVVAGVVVARQFEGTGGEPGIPPGGSGPAEHAAPIRIPLLSLPSPR